METEKKFVVKIVVLWCRRYGDGLLKGEAPRFLAVCLTGECGVAYNLQFVDSGSIKIQCFDLMNWDLAHLALKLHRVAKHYVIAREGQGSMLQLPFMQQ